MIWAFIVPELYVLWALRQRIFARRIARELSEHGWTTTHGFFLLMGGFHLYEGIYDVGVLSRKQFESLLMAGKIHFPSFTREDIQDKSKADALAKGLAMLQTTWFIAQCIARATQKLPLTEMEVVTLGLAVLNVIVYILWWEKPLDIQRPFAVHFKDAPVLGTEDIARAERGSSIRTGSSIDTMRTPCTPIYFKATGEGESDKTSIVESVVNSAVSMNSLTSAISNLPEEVKRTWKIRDIYKPVFDLFAFICTDMKQYRVATYHHVE
ncbi:unnamed protein product [Cyclocybe aegerita]|uniref:Uncharacterized protein n=1 Tax=Cyclocybe aegerita TaxID=1973307 RepID=A0A8S0WAL5_CYCAE|nr:unnamed protein product [Cyclocybe aegerita]